MAKKWIGPKPVKCDLCGKPLSQQFVDGKTIMGPWGIMCAVCHHHRGVGVGTGRGQRYDLESLEKIEG